MFNRKDLIQLAAILISCFPINVFSSGSRRPNIVIVLADDLGWNDVGFHGSNQIQTPNIDSLAYNGIILNSHYVPALCTPSRASLLTGKYPTSMGMQHLVILASEPWGLPLEETLMAQHFKRHGYATHAIGKWHLGYHEKEYTPIYRGFDSHFGYWNGFHDYYDHTMHSESLKGYDMRRGLEVDYASEGHYSTDAFTDEAVAIIENHNSTRGPLFLYLSHLAPHAGNPDDPLQAPEEEISKHSHIADRERRIYAAMVTKLDEGLGKVVSALRKSNMLDNSIILFMSDNGAVTFGVHSNRGSNHPLRGLKESPWEGGVRNVAAIWSPLLNRTKRVSNQLMHTSDWLPTLFTAAGLDTAELGQIDGLDMWDALSNDLESVRTEVFHNYDEIENYSSLRVGPWKLVEGTAQGGEVDQWYGESGEDGDHQYDLSKILNSETNQAINGYGRTQVDANKSSKTGEDEISEETILRLRQKSVVTCDYPTFSSLSLLSENHSKSESESSISFNSRRDFGQILGISDSKKKIILELERIRRDSPREIPQGGFQFSESEAKKIGDLFESGRLRESLKCDPLKSTCLFNLISDPCERINLAEIFPDLLISLSIRLIELKGRVAKPLNLPEDPLSNPDFHNGTWSNWRDRDPGFKFSRPISKLIEFATSVSDLDRLIEIVSPEMVFLEEFVYPSVLTVHESTLRLIRFNKWILWLMGIGTIVLAIRKIHFLSLLSLVRKALGSSGRDWERIAFSGGDPEESLDKNG